MALVMLVEDETIVAIDLAMTLREGGHEILGPFRKPDIAMSAVDRHRPDLAILDINLGREGNSFALAQKLFDTGIPFAFLTGYSRATADVPAPLDDAPRLQKPIDPRSVIDFVDGLIGA